MDPFNVVIMMSNNETVEHILERYNFTKFVATRNITLFDADIDIIENHPRASEITFIKIHMQHHISRLPNLSKLDHADIYDCSNIEYLPNWPNLTRLNCRKLPVVSEIPPFEKIEYMESLYMMDRIKKLPNHDTILSISLSNVNIKELPDYPNIKSINIFHCDALKKIPYFPQLIYLHLSWCDNISQILSPISAISHLTIYTDEDNYFKTISLLKESASDQIKFSSITPITDGVTPVVVFHGNSKKIRIYIKDVRNFLKMSRTKIILLKWIRLAKNRLS